MVNRTDRTDKVVPILKLGEARRYQPSSSASREEQHHIRRPRDASKNASPSAVLVRGALERRHADVPEAGNDELLAKTLHHCHYDKHYEELVLPLERDRDR